MIGNQKGYHSHALIIYQFRSEERVFMITPHGNSKSNSKGFIWTQKSTFDDLKENVKHHLQPRIAMDSVSESRGGINSAPSSGSIPRNTNQVCNLFKSKEKPSTQRMTSDRYLDLIIKCKGQCKNPKTTFIQKWESIEWYRKILSEWDKVSFR